VTRRGPAGGFTLIEVLVSLTILLLSLAALATLLVQNARVNRAQQMTLSTQSNARSCLSIVTPVLRTAGWDPLNAGFSPVTLDPSGNGNSIQVFADLNEDGDTLDSDEDVTIRYTMGRLEWKKSAGGAFEILSEDISNDSDGDGLPEPMFVPDDTSRPRRIAVTITARSPVPDPRNGLYIRSTASTDVLLRRNL
jgi:prepilin-type N-terminal cleavage/methylation domain-containing protein